MKKIDVKSLTTDQIIHIWKVWYKKKMDKNQEKQFKILCKEYKERTGRDFPRKPGKSRKM